MMANTTALDAMCGALPVSAEDAPGIAAAVQRLTQGYDANGSPVDEETKTLRALDALDTMGDEWAEAVNLKGMVANIPVNCQTLEFEARARESIEALMHLAYVEGLYEGRTSHYTQSANEQLSRDLIEAARDSKGG